jgi:phosphatidate cytidylyltransferase
MAEHDDDHPTQPPRPTGEGIRIIGAEEAASAIESGAAEGRRPADAPRFGDVPSPPPPTSRPPAMRFPLESEEEEPYGDTEGVAGTRVEPPPGSRPLIAGGEPPAERRVPFSAAGPARAAGSGYATGRAGGDPRMERVERAGGDPRMERVERAGGDPRMERGERAGGDPGHGPAGTNRDPTQDLGRNPRRYPARDAAYAASQHPDPDEPTRRSVGGASGPMVAGSGQGPDLPHWTEPPTGEVPAILSGEGEEQEEWRGFARTPRWRDSGDDWNESEFGDATLLADDETRLGALDTDRPDVADLYNFDEPEAEPAPAPTRIRTRSVGDRPGGGRAGGGRAGGGRAGGGRARPPAGADNTQRVVIGVALGAMFITAAIGPAALVTVCGVIIVLLTAELFAVLRRAGYKPATLLGLVATAALVFGSYWKGERAVPLVIVLTIAFTFLWYLAGVVHTRPTVNIAATLLAFGWGGVLGSFAALLLRPPGVAGHSHDGVAFLWAAVGCTVVNDVIAFVAGQAFGRTPLAPNVSPGKTVEGFAVALAVTVLFGLAVIGHIHPFTMSKGFVIGLAIAIVAPLGDLCESMVKRDIGLKDMGASLPGHGGLSDRFDGLLFALPATYYLLQMLHVGVM